MKIALLSSFFPPDIQYDGIARYVEDLALGLIEQGMNVIVIAAGSLTERVEQRGKLTIYRLSKCRCKQQNLLFPSFHYLHTALKMRRILIKLHKQSPFDIIEYPNTHFNGIACLALGLPSPTPLYIERMSSPRAVNPKKNIFLPNLITFLESWQTIHSDALISNSKANLKICEKVYSFPKDIPARVIPHGLPIGKIQSSTPRQPTDKLNIFFLGRMNRRKGFDILASAWADIAEQVPSAHLIVAGEDMSCAYGNSFFQWATKDIPSNARKKIKYYGKISPKLRDRLYQEAYICVMPSRYESFGLVLLESMQFGVPSVSVDVGGIPEVIQDEKTGLLVPPDDPGALSKAIVRLLQNNFLYKSIKTALKQSLINNFSIERVATQTIAFYRSQK